MSRDDDSDVMAGIVDSDSDEEHPSVSTNPFIKFMPAALSGANNRRQQHPLPTLPKNEKGIDRLVLMMKYPNAREEEIQDALRRKEIQQQTIQAAALRKGQLFRQKTQLEDAEHWRQQQQQNDKRLPKAQAMKQDENEPIQIKEGGRTNIKQFLLKNKKRELEERAEGGAGRAVSNGVSLRRPLEEAGDEEGGTNTMVWQAATDGNDFVGFEHGVSAQSSTSMKDQKDSYHSSKNIVQQTRKSIKSVFGSASKMFGNIKPLSAADANALASDSMSLDTTNGYDSRSVGHNHAMSDASVVTEKVSNIRPPISNNGGESDHRRENNIYLVSTYNSSSSDHRNDETNNKKSSLFDRKKNKLLVFVFSLVIIVAGVVILLAAIYGENRNASVESPKLSESQKNDSAETVIPSPLPTIGASEKIESNETTHIPSIDNNLSHLTPPSEEDYGNDRGETVSPKPPTSMTTKPPLDTIKTTPESTAAPTAVPTKTPTTFPTKAISTFKPTEQPFSDWQWSKGGEEGSLLQGIPGLDVHFGQSIALSDDGKILAIGAPDALDKAGIVRIYAQVDGSWVAAGSMFGRNQGDRFGSAVAMSSDGRILAVSEPSFADKRGNVRTFINGPFGYMVFQEIQGENASDQFGIGIALSSDGQRLAVGAPHHDNGVGQDRLMSGSAKVFALSEEENEWRSVGNGSGGTLLIGFEDRDRFGWSIDLNDDGSLLCVGAPRNEKYGGYVQCFEESGSGSSKEWKHVGNTIRNRDGLVRYDDQFGASIRITRDPSGTRHRLAIGAHGKDSENIFNAGHVIVYEFNPSTAERGWIGLGRTVITSEKPGKDFGMGFSLDFHQDLLAVGIPGANDGVGKVEVFQFQKDSWEWKRNPTVFDGLASGLLSYGYDGAISMTPSGDFAVGSPQSNNEVGSVRFYRRIE